MAVERIGSIIKHLAPGSALNQVYVTAPGRLGRGCRIVTDAGAASPRMPTTSSSRLPSARP